MSWQRDHARRRLFHRGSAGNMGRDDSYGKSFRSMDAADKEKEVVNLNKNAAKGMKVVIKTKTLASSFQVIVAKKLREHLKRPGLRQLRCSTALLRQ